MNDAQAREAEAIMLAQQAQIEALQEELQRRQDPILGGGITDSALCSGCYRWRLTIALLMGGGLGVGAAVLCVEQNAFLLKMGLDPDAMQFALTAVASPLPLAAVVADWKWTLYKNGHPGMIRALANMLAEFKRGLRA